MVVAVPREDGGQSRGHSGSGVILMPRVALARSAAHCVLQDCRLSWVAGLAESCLQPGRLPPMLLFTLLS